MRTGRAGVETGAFLYYPESQTAGGNQAKQTGGTSRAPDPGQDPSLPHLLDLMPVLFPGQEPVIETAIPDAADLLKMEARPRGGATAVCDTTLLAQLLCFMKGAQVRLWTELPNDHAHLICLND